MLVVDCFDCANGSAASDLALAEAKGRRVVRDSASSGHAYKAELIEVFGSAYTISDARVMLPRNPAAPVSTLFLANEIYTFATSARRPPIMNYWPWERVKDYYSSPEGYDRPYGYAFRPEGPSSYPVVTSSGLDTLTLLVDLLRSQPTTKRAVVTFQRSEYLEPSRDTPCPIATQYRIIDGELCTATSYRSHDFFGGYRTDPLRVSFVQQFVAAALRTVDCDVTVGSMTQFDGSVHFYPLKPHGSLEDLANWRHGDDVPPHNWEFFTADYFYLEDVRRDLMYYLRVVDLADASSACRILCPKLREYAVDVLNAIVRAQVKYRAMMERRV